MEHLYESLLLDTIDGLQCKVYANSHPEGKIVVKPKYIPENGFEFKKLKKRYLFETALFRFNLFTDLEAVRFNIDQLKKKLPDYFLESKGHDNWFIVVPKEKISKIHDPKKGLKELLKIPEQDLDNYLKAVRNLISLISQSRVATENLGINHSTLLGNYTPGKSDIDIVVYGKANGWKVINFLSKVYHPELKWKEEEDWRKYYKDRIVSKNFTEDEYVANMIQKKDDGMFCGNVFSIFVVEEPEEAWYNWNDVHTRIGTVKVVGKVKDAYNSIVRPGYYELENSRVIHGADNVPVKRIVTWSRPFSLQAKTGDEVECVGLLESVESENCEKFNQVVLGYFDAYTSDRGEKEYLKKISWPK